MRWPWSSDSPRRGGVGRSPVRRGGAGHGALAGAGAPGAEGPRSRIRGEGINAAKLLARYWQRTRRLVWLIVALWFVLTFVSTWFARDLGFSFFGWPFSFWLAAQGAPVLYLALVIWYGRHMERLDRRYGVEERDLS